MISINNGELQGHQLHLKMVSRRIILSQESRRKHYLKRRVKFQRAQQKGGTKEEQWKVKKKYYFQIKGDRRKNRQPKTIYFDCWARLTEIWHVVLNLLQGCKRKKLRTSCRIDVFRQNQRIYLGEKTRNYTKFPEASLLSLWFS